MLSASPQSGSSGQLLPGRFRRLRPVFGRSGPLNRLPKPGAVSACGPTPELPEKSAESERSVCVRNSARRNASAQQYGKHDCLPAEVRHRCGLPERASGEWADAANVVVCAPVPVDDLRFSIALARPGLRQLRGSRPSSNVCARGALIPRIDRRFALMKSSRRTPTLNQAARWAPCSARQMPEQE